MRLLTSGDGPSRGVRLIEVRTGTGFAFEIAVDRGFDVARADYRGASLGWTPPTLLPGPWFFEDQSGFGWLRAGLGGFNNTCGYIHIGNPEEASVAHYNFPARPTERYGVHDRAALLPAEIVAMSDRWEDGRRLLEVTGRITQAQTYGENLVVTRTYRAAMGESWFTMEDVVENAGFLPTEHMLLYHINAGYPFVDEGSELIAPVAGPPKLLFGAADLADPRELVPLHRPAEGLGAADLRAPHAARRRRPGRGRHLQPAAFSAAPRSASATTTASCPTSSSGG